MKKPRWTTEEDTRLRELYPANAQTLIEAFPNRSLGTIRVRAHSLGITRKYTKKAVTTTTTDAVPNVRWFQRTMRQLKAI